MCVYIYKNWPENQIMTSMNFSMICDFMILNDSVVLWTGPNSCVWFEKKKKKVVSDLFILIGYKKNEPLHYISQEIYPIFYREISKLSNSI